MHARPLPAEATVAVAGGKGGCGKTTATLGLALALVDRGRRPIVVDADVDVPDLHIRAGVERTPGLPAVRDGAPPGSVSQASPTHSGVAVLSAGAGRGGIQTALERVSALDRPILLDCPAGAGPDASDPLRVADATVVVSTATRAGRTDAAKTVQMARSLDAEPIAWLERTVEGVDAGDDPPVKRGLPTVVVPDGGRHPLRNRTVREAFGRLATATFALDRVPSGSTEPRSVHGSTGPARHCRGGGASDGQRTRPNARYGQPRNSL